MDLQKSAEAIVGLRTSPKGRTFSQRLGLDDSLSWCHSNFILNGTDPHAPMVKPEGKRIWCVKWQRHLKEPNP
jgi:hypothetical protein